MDCKKIKSNKAGCSETDENKFLYFMSDAIKNLSYAVPSADFDKKVLSVFTAERKPVYKYITLGFLCSSAIFSSWVLAGFVFLFIKYGFRLFPAAGIYFAKMLVTIKQIISVSDTLLIVTVSALNGTKLLMLLVAGLIGFGFLVFMTRKYETIKLI